MIEMCSVYKSYMTKYETVPVLKGINLSVRKGEMVSIMGASGSGKSTLLNVLGLLDGFDDGEYRIGGESVKNLSDNQMAFYRNRLIGFVFQSANLIPQMDVWITLYCHFHIERCRTGRCGLKARRFWIFLVFLIGADTIPMNFPEDRNKGWPLPERLLLNRTSFLPMSLPGNWILS